MLRQWFGHNCLQDIFHSLNQLKNQIIKSYTNGKREISFNSMLQKICTKTI